MKLFSGITADRHEQSNLKTLIAKDSFHILFGTFVAVPVIQAFLISRGATDFQIGLTNTFINICILLSIVVFMGRIDSVSSGKIVHLNRNMSYILAVFPLILVFLSLTGDLTGSVGIFIGVAAAWSLHSFISMAKSMVDTRICQNIFRTNIYGYAYGLDGMIFNSIGILGGLLIKPVLARSYGPVSGFGAVFIAAVFMMPGIAYFSGKFKLLREPETDTGNKSISPFRYFTAAFAKKNLKNAVYLHIVRGVVNGMAVFILPLGVRYFGMPLSYAAYMVMISSFSGVMAYVFITLFYDRLGTIRSVMIGSALAGGALAGLIFTRDTIFFMVIAALFMIGLTIVGSSVPLGVYKITPTDFISSFTGIRHFVMHIIEALMTLALGAFIIKVPLVAILLFVIFFQMLQIFFSIRSFAGEDGSA